MPGGLSPARDAIDKVVVLAAGMGTRMRSPRDGVPLSRDQAHVAETGVKALIPVGRPFLDYVLSGVADAGYRDVCLVIGPRHGPLRDRYARLSGGRLQMSFAIQQQPLGTAHALASASAFVGSDEFLLINSDNYYPTSALLALRLLGEPGLVGFDARCLTVAGNIPPERVSRFAIIRADECGNLQRIVEKPDLAQVTDDAAETLVSMNCWRFGPEILNACVAIGVSQRGEFELPEAVTYSMRELGQRYRVLRSREPVLDLSSRDDIQSVAQHLESVEVRW